MKSRSLLVCLLLAVPALAPGASKEIQELQRDVALLQQQIKDLQRSQDEKFAAVTELARQSIDAANKANTSVAVIASTIEKNLRDQTDKVVTPVVGFSTRLNEMGGDLRTLSQAVSDLTALLNRMQAQLTDVSNAIKVIQQPPVAPPAATRPGRRGAAASRRAPDVGETMYNAARQDYVSGKYDLAMQEFADYLKYYGNTGFAPNAQFYIAMIHFVQEQLRNRRQGIRHGAGEVPGQQQDGGCTALQGPRAGQNAGAQDRRRRRIHGSDPALPQERPIRAGLHGAQSAGPELRSAGLLRKAPAKRKK